MTEMFSGASTFNQNLSSWCVSNITSEPSSFNTSSGFVNESSKQPQWGKCPIITVASFSPLNGSSNSSIDTNLSAMFNENIAFASSGNITLYKTSANTLIETFNVSTGNGGNSGKVTRTGSILNIDPGASLDKETSYYVLIDNGAITNETNGSKTYAGISSSTTWSFTTETNSAPSINTTYSTVTVNEDNGTTNYDINISDSDSDVLSLTVESNDTSLITVSTGWDNNLSSATYANAQDFNLSTVANASGVAKITVTLSDGTATATKTFNVIVNAAPVVTSTAVTSATEDSAYSYTLEASDADGGALTWSATSLPSWLSLNSSSIWETVGTAGFSADEASFTSIAFDSADTPYVVYEDFGNSQKASMMKYDGTGWVPVGTAGFSAGTAGFTSIAFDSTDTPYVVYQDEGNSNKASVMKYDGSSWVPVGTAGFSAGEASYTSIAFDSADTPYVVYVDYGNIQKASVMKYDGSGWVPVGTAGFSAGTAGFTSIAFDSADTPYVVYEDGGNSNKASVMKYDGTGWVDVGDAGFSAAAAYYTSIAFDSADTPYVVYKDYGNSKKASVMKYDGTGWVQVGTAGFSAGEAKYTSIAFDSTDIPYVVYKDYGNGYKASVMKYDGSSWDYVGSAGFSTGAGIVGGYTSIAFDSTATPYVVYKDEGNSNKASVMKFHNVSKLTGTPANSDVGVSDINLTLSDGDNNVSYNFEINVSNVNDAPAASDINITIDEDTVKTFAADDFNFSDEDSIYGDTLEAVYITSLENNGSLRLNGSDVTLNQEIPASSLSSLIFTPASNANGSAYATFKFKVNDGDLNSSEYTATINVTAINDPVVWSNLENNSTNEDGILRINLYDYIYDEENNTSLVFYSESNNTALADTAIDSGNTLVVLPNSDGSGGVVSVTISAYDGDNNISTDINITINNNTDVPNLEDDNITEDDEFTEQPAPDLSNASYKVIKGVKYAIFSDAGNNGKLSIMKEVNGEWEYLESYEGFSDPDAQITSINKNRRGNLIINYKVNAENKQETVPSEDL